MLEQIFAGLTKGEMVLASCLPTDKSAIQEFEVNSLNFNNRDNGTVCIETKIVYKNDSLCRKSCVKILIYEPIFLKFDIFIILSLFNRDI